MRRLCLPSASMLLLALAGCSGTLGSQRVRYEPESFDSTTTHARNFVATQAQTCEAARRALLSQGYLINAASAEQVTGRKNFQPAAEVHLEVEFRVVCAAEGQRGIHGGVGRGSVAFASAVQDRYSLKKTNNSASVGVGAIGSVSLPFSSSDDALVKVASETLSDALFYERFFALIDRYLVLDAPADATAGGGGKEEGATPAVAPVPARGQADKEPTDSPVAATPTRG